MLYSYCATAPAILHYLLWDRNAALAARTRTKENRVIQTARRLLTRRQERRSKHDMPEMPIAPRPQRQYQPCPISGEPIDDILSAIDHPGSGQPARFDSTLAAIAKYEKPEQNERICYIGAGRFAVVSETREKGTKKLEIIRVIDYERRDRVSEWRAELSPTLGLGYKPTPEPVDTLYTREQLSKFPNFDRPAPQL